MKKTILVIGFLWVSAAAQAAVVYMRDGRRIEGTVVNATAAEVQLHTPEGLLKIDTSKISRVEYEGGSSPIAAERPPVFSPAREPRRTGPLHTFSINLGMGIPVSELDLTAYGAGKASNGDLGFLAGVQYLYPLGSRLSFGPEVEFSARGSADSEELFTNANSRVSGGTILAQMVLKQALADGDGARPYIAIGAGAHRTATRLDTRPLPGFSWSDTSTDESRRLVDDTSLGFAGSAKIGVDIPLSGMDYFSFELGWTGLFEGIYEPTTAGKDLGLGRIENDLHNFTVGIRWGWRF